jgi:hypothetical protein
VIVADPERAGAGGVGLIVKVTGVLDKLEQLVEVFTASAK